MRIFLFYFSGTRNTYNISLRLAEAFKQNGHEVRLFDLYQKNNFDLKECDLLGFGYPIHGFNLPRFYLKKVRELNIIGKNYFIYKVSGEPFKLNTASSYPLYHYLNKDNFFLEEYHLLGAYNILFKTKTDFLVLERQYMDFFISYIASSLPTLGPKHKHYNLFYRFTSFLFRIIYLGSILNSFLVKFDTDKCFNCQKCLNDCPTGAITIKEGKMKVRPNCMMCMRCSYYCPKDALRIGFLNHYKVNGPYGIPEGYETNYSFSDENNRFYRGFKHYFLYLDSLKEKKRTPKL